MKITNEFTVHTPIERAWAVLTDLEGIAPCLPGAQLTGVDGDTYSGKVKVKVGPVVSDFAGTARFVEKDDNARRAVIDAKGRDSRSAGNAAAVVTAQLRADGDRTLVNVDTDLKISGKLAQFGSGMIKEVSGKLLGQFVANLEAKLAAEPAAGGDPASLAGGGANAVPANAVPANAGSMTAPTDVESAGAAPADSTTVAGVIGHGPAAEKLRGTAGESAAGLAGVDSGQTDSATASPAGTDPVGGSSKDAGTAAAGSAGSGAAGSGAAGSGAAGSGSAGAAGGGSAGAGLTGSGAAGGGSAGIGSASDGSGAAGSGDTGPAAAMPADSPSTANQPAPATGGTPPTASVNGTAPRTLPALNGSAVVPLSSESGGAEVAAGTPAHDPAAGEPGTTVEGDAAASGKFVRVQDEPEALDLLALAGGSVYKRAIPLGIGAVVVAAVIVWFVARR